MWKASAWRIGTPLRWVSLGRVLQPSDRGAFVCALVFNNRQFVCLSRDQIKQKADIAVNVEDLAAAALLCGN
jgi:hypothetical protein